MTPAACSDKMNTAMMAVTEGYMLASYNPVPVSETVSGSEGVTITSISVCKATAAGACVPGTTAKGELKTVYGFGPRGKVTSISVSEKDDALAAFYLSADESEARQKAMPVAGILITTFVLSALSIGCYQFGKKHGQQAMVSEGYTNLLDA